MDLATLGLTVDARGAVSALDRFTGSASRAASSGTLVEKTAGRMRSALSALGLVFGIHQAIEYADTWQLLGNRVQLVTQNHAVAAAVMQRLYDVAQNSRSSLESVGTLYFRVARASGQLGRSQNELIRFTELITKSMIVGGATTQEMRSAMIQLSQALVSGKLQGEEFRSVMHNMPGVVDALTKRFHTTVGGLYELRRAGKITSNDLVAAVLEAGNRIDKDFADLPVTIGQSFLRVENAMIRFIGEGSRTSGVGQAIAKTMSWVADNMNLVAKIIAMLILYWGTYRTIVATTNIVMALSAALHTANTRAMVNESRALAPLVGLTASFEEVAAGAGAASLGMAAGETAAAAATVTLGGTISALVDVLLGPVGLAIALGTVIALLIKYVTASSDASEATQDYRIKLMGMSKEQLNAERTRLDAEIARRQRELKDLEAQGQTREFALRPSEQYMAPLQNRAVDMSQETSEHRRARERVEALQAQRTAVTDQLKVYDALNERLGNLGNQQEQLTSKERARLRFMLDFRHNMQEMVRAATADVDASRLQGMAQEEYRIRLDATNSLMRDRDNLAEKVLQGTISAADAATLGAEAERKYAEATELRITALQSARVAELRISGAQRQAEQLQSIELAFRQGMAQEDLRIHYQAVNKEIEARNTLTGEAQQVALQNIRSEEQLAQRLVRVENFARTISDTFRDSFAGILTDGISAFGDLFSQMKSMFFRTLAEMATDRLMKVMGNKLMNFLYGDAADRAKTAVTALQNTISSIYATPSVVPGGGQTIDLKGITAVGQTATARNREMLQKYMGYLSAAMTGYALGQMFGYSTGSSVLGALGGGISGAATGFMMAGPVGGIIGGIAGLGAGILGAHKKHEEQERARAELLRRNNERLAALRETISGVELLAGRNLAGALPLSQAILGIGSGSGGGLMGWAHRAVSQSQLITALQGGASSASIQALERQYGVTVQQLGRMARQLGIELFDSAGKLIPDALKQLNEALKLSIEAATKFGNSLDDLRLQQNARNKLYDLDSPGQQLNDAYEILTKMAPDLMKQMGLANLNLTTEAGRNVLLQGLRDIFELISSGNLTPELLGAFTDKGKLIEAILGAKDGLDAFKQSLDDVTTDFPKAMDLIIFEQQRGHGVGTSGIGTIGGNGVPVTDPQLPRMGASAGGFTVGGNLIIVNQGDETGEELLQKIEDAVAARANRNTVTYLPLVVTERA